MKRIWVAVCAMVLMITLCVIELSFTNSSIGRLTDTLDQAEQGGLFHRFPVKRGSAGGLEQRPQGPFFLHHPRAAGTDRSFLRRAFGAFRTG